MFFEPAVRDDSSEHHGGHTGSRADTHTPEERQMPLCMHMRRQGNRAREKRQRAQNESTQPPAVHERSSKRSDESEKGNVNRYRKRNGCACPSELRLKWH